METDFKAFDNATIDFFYDDYFKGEEGHDDYTDEQITMSVERVDIEHCLETMRSVLYKHFGIEVEEQL